MSCVSQQHQASAHKSRGLGRRPKCTKVYELMLFKTLRFSIPTEIRDLFILNRDIREKVTRIHSTDLMITEFSKSKLSYSGVMLFNSLPAELKMIDILLHLPLKQTLNNFSFI